MNRTLAVSVSATFVFVAIAGAALLSRGPSNKGSLGGPIRPKWTEVRWPFPVDPWGKGKAFQCKAVDCGSEVRVYVRAKLGFCNCATGVADDGDLEQMGDLALIGNATPIGAGKEIIVGPMRGRSRTYRVERNSKTALSLAFNQRCDMVAATALVGPGEPASLEPAVLAFLNSDRILKWAEIALGL